MFHPFYKDLKTSQEAKDTYLDDIPDEETEEAVLVEKGRNVQNPKKKKTCDQNEKKYINKPAKGK